MKLALNKRSIKQAFKLNQRKLVFLVFSLSIIGCQSVSENYNVVDTQNEPTNIITAPSANFGQYYLAIQNLSESELQKEVALQQLRKLQGSSEARIYLTLLYSLPSSPIHSVYTAKLHLNNLLQAHQTDHLNSIDQAFVLLLKDQLNQQLFLFQKLIKQGADYDKKAAEHRISNKKQLNEIAALELTVKQLSEQITQLKKIEKNISEHGQ